MLMHPILTSLRHHKLTAILLVMQVALTCAIVCNVVYLIADRVSQISVKSGVDEPSVSMIMSQSIDKNANKIALHDTDLAALRGIPGVTMAAAVDTLPLGASESSYGTCATLADFQRVIQTQSIDVDGCVQPAVYAGTPGVLGTLGLHLIAGRDFQDSEYVTSDDNVSAVIVSAALANKLFLKGNALGQVIYSGQMKPMRIVGIVDPLIRPNLYGFGSNDWAMLYPKKPSDMSDYYILRSAPEDRERVLRDASAMLMKINPNRILVADKIRTYTQMRQAYFRRDVTMSGMLIASCIGLLFVTALGISGLANFWVQQRRKQIGVRRAIGATRGDILRYFLAENFLIVTGGIVLGAALALVLNLVLMKQYEVPRLPLYYLPIGAVALWILGQLAVLAPALRAAAVPPVVATRTV